MNQNLKKHACGSCDFSTSRKFNLDRHIKRKHSNQHLQPIQAQHVWTQEQNDKIQAIYKEHGHKHGFQGVEKPIDYPQHIQNQQIVDQYPLDVVYHHPQPVVHQPVQAQQGWQYQQGDRVRVLCPKHNREKEVIYQTYQT